MKNVLDDLKETVSDLTSDVNQRLSQLKNFIPNATLEGLKHGEIFIPYTVLLNQIDQRLDKDAEVEIISMVYMEGGSILIAVKHNEYGEGLFRVMPVHFDIALREAKMALQVDVVELKADSMKSKLLCKVAQWFPQRVLKYALNEKSPMKGMKTKVIGDNQVQIELTEYIQSLPLAAVRIPVINQSPLAWLRLTALTAEQEGIRIRCGWNRV